MSFKITFDFQGKRFTYGQYETEQKAYKALKVVKQEALAFQDTYPFKSVTVGTIHLRGKDFKIELVKNINDE